MTWSQKKVLRPRGDALVRGKDQGTVVVFEDLSMNRGLERGRKSNGSGDFEKQATNRKQDPHGPLLWFSLALAPSLFRPAIDAYFDPEPRSCRREHGRLRQRERARHNRSRNYPGSIRHHGLHRQYPLSLKIRPRSTPRSTDVLHVAAYVRTA